MSKYHKSLNDSSCPKRNYESCTPIIVIVSQYNFEKDSEVNNFGNVIRMQKVNTKSSVGQNNLCNN
jgi:hypothetical protein